MTDSQENSPETAPPTSQESNPAPADGAADSSQAETSPAAPVEAPQPQPAPAAPKPSGGPLSLDRIRQLRKSQQAAAPKLAPIPTKQTGPKPSKGVGKSRGRAGKHPSASGEDESNATEATTVTESAQEIGVIKTPAPGVAPKIEVPSTRQPLSQELEDELAAALGSGDLDNLLVGDSMLQVGHSLTEGQRIQGRVVKVHWDQVFVTLGGPNEGVLATTQFEDLPEAGAQIEVVVRGYVAEEGLYELTIPGGAVEVSDWDDLNEGEVIEVHVTGSNSGGLECKAGSVRGFIPASQVAEYRVENLADMVDQKVLCVITEANPRRGNLVLSRRAVLEREKREKREERLAALQVGDAVDGTVTKIMDFGAFVDIGGLDGLLHISQLSWERVSHPSEVLEQGQQIQVRVDKIDPQSGKIGLSYRSLQDHPWTGINDRFPVGSIVDGNVTRIAEFGAFVKIATGVEGLVHLSELAHHRVHSVGNVVSEGQDVQVKVLSIDEAAQRISLSIKEAQAAPEKPKSETEAEPEAPPAKPVLPKHTGPLKGGRDRPSGGEQFGLKW